VRDLSFVASTIYLHPTLIAVAADDNPQACKASRGFPRQKADDANSRTVRMALNRSALRIENVAKFPEGGASVRISYRLRPSRSRRPGILVDRRAARVVVAAYASKRGEKSWRERGTETREIDLFNI